MPTIKVVLEIEIGAKAERGKKAEKLKTNEEYIDWALSFCEEEFDGLAITKIKEI